MAATFHVAFDCADPGLLARFWADALGYQLEDPPAGFDGWNSYWRSVGVPVEELDSEDGADSIVDPAGACPRIWFQPVPEGKTVKNRVHFDIQVSGGRTADLAIRKERVDAEVERLVIVGATKLRVLEQPGLDHYAVAMSDPEGNEFDVC